MTQLAGEARASCERYRWDNVRSQWIALYHGLVGPRALPAPNAV